MAHKGSQKGSDMSDHVIAARGERLGERLIEAMHGQGAELSDREVSVIKTTPKIKAGKQEELGKQYARELVASLNERGATWIKDENGRIWVAPAGEAMIPLWTLTAPL
jgi:hypothetical protein